MASVPDQDRFFSGQHKSSTPRHTLAEGEVARLLNARFIEGAISNGIGFDELEFTFSGGNDQRVFASSVTYGELLSKGDVQLVAPLVNINGKFLVLVISGILFLADLDTCIAYDITPRDACLPESSAENHLSYLDNDGGTYGTGGYLVIFNYPNRPIFVNQNGARIARKEDPFFEMPTSRLGVTAGNRAFITSGDNLMWGSDPLGGSSALAPLTFQDTLDGGTGFTGQVFSIGSGLDVETVTAMCRLPKFLGPSQDFLAQNVLVSTRRHKYIVAAGTPRTNWVNTQFITFYGSSAGIAGPLACTNIGSNIVYIDINGRIKTLGQDQQHETTLAETFIDDGLGQYLCECEPSFYHRDWYKDLDHSRGILKFSQDRLYATVYPFFSPAIGKFGEERRTISHRAVAVGSLDSTTLLGAKASIAWEGFYDWMNPVGMVTVGEDLYIVTKDKFGRIQYFKDNLSVLDSHDSIVYTRGYFSSVGGKGKSLLRAGIYLRRNPGPLKVRISYLANDEWVCLGDCELVPGQNFYEFSLQRHKCKTDSWSIPLKIDVAHKGCRFELESIRVDGEVHRDT